MYKDMMLSWPKPPRRLPLSFIACKLFLKKRSTSYLIQWQTRLICWHSCFRLVPYTCIVIWFPPAKSATGRISWRTSIQRIARKAIVCFAFMALIPLVASSPSQPYFCYGAFDAFPFFDKGQARPRRRTWLLSRSQGPLQQPQYFFITLQFQPPAYQSGIRATNSQVRGRKIVRLPSAHEIIMLSKKTVPSLPFSYVTKRS